MYIPKKGEDFEIIDKKLVQCSDKEIVLNACNAMGPTVKTYVEVFALLSMRKEGNTQRRLFM